MEPPDASAPLVCHLIHTLEGGGTERMLVQLLAHFDRATARHAVVTLRRAGTLASRLPDDVACHPLDLVGRSSSAGWTLTRFLRRLRPALLHARGIGCWMDALVASRLLPGCRLLLGFHGTDRVADFSPKEIFKIRLAGRLGARFSAVAHASADVLARHAGTAAPDIAVLPNGVDAEQFQAIPQSRARRRAELRLPVEAVLAGTIGSLTRVKGPDQLLEAFIDAAPRAPKLHLLVVGDGPLLGELALAASRARLSDRVHFVPANEHVADWLAALDLYVCPSRSEGLSNALLEALAAGKPVITTDVGDHARVIRNGAEGRVVAPDNPERLSAALVELSRRADLRSTMAAAAARRAEDYRFDACVNRYDRLYADLLCRDALPIPSAVGPVPCAAVR